MAKSTGAVSVLATKIETRDGKGLVCVRIKNPYGNNDFDMEIMVEKVNDPNHGLDEARIKIFQFAKALMDRMGDKGSLTFG